MDIFRHCGIIQINPKQALKSMAEIMLGWLFRTMGIILNLVLSDIMHDILFKLNAANVFDCKLLLFFASVFWLLQYMKMHTPLCKHSYLLISDEGLPSS